MPEATLHFPPDFRWGCATAAHQVEGNNTNNDWWAWEQGEGTSRRAEIRPGVRLVGRRPKRTWTSPRDESERAPPVDRVEPHRAERGPVGRRRRSIAIGTCCAMRERGIEPMVTLHHFTNPLWVVERGGWETPTSCRCSSGSLTKVVEALKDLVRSVGDDQRAERLRRAGLVAGRSRESSSRHQLRFPPGKHDLDLVFKVVDHLMLAHGAAYHAIHRVQPQARVGLAHHMRLFDPHPNSPLDQLLRLEPRSVVQPFRLECHAARAISIGRSG